MLQPVTFLRSVKLLGLYKTIGGDSLCFQISVNMRAKTLHNSRDIWSVTTDEWIMATAGGTKETERT